MEPQVAKFKVLDGGRASNKGRPRRPAPPPLPCEVCGSRTHDALSGHYFCTGCETIPDARETSCGECAERHRARRGRCPGREELSRAATPADGYTTTALLDDYVKARKARQRSAGDGFYEGHAKALRRLLPRLARDITHATLLGYIEARRAEGAGEVVRKELHGDLRPAHKLAYKSDLFGRDPAKVIPELDSLAKPRDRWLTPAEARGVIDFLASNPRQDETTRRASPSQSPPGPSSARGSTRGERTFARTTGAPRSTGPSVRRASASPGAAAGAAGATSLRESERPRDGPGAVHDVEHDEREYRPPRSVHGPGHPAVQHERPPPLVRLMARPGRRARRADREGHGPQGVNGPRAPLSQALRRQSAAPHGGRRRRPATRT